MGRNDLIGTIVIIALVVIIVILSVFLCVQCSISRVEALQPTRTRVTSMSTVKPEPIPQNTTQDNTTIIDLDDAPESQMRTLGVNNDLEILSATRKEQLEDMN